MWKDALQIMGLLKKWPTYTKEEVALHHQPDDCWITAGNRVYDVTAFVATHPGGAQAILNRAGGRRDCTRDMEFHSAAARTQWGGFQIGELSS